MATSGLSVRTITHSYPKEETDAMELFYGGKKCVITNLSRNVQWFHMLDAALGVSSPRVRLNVYWILHKVANHEPISFRICLGATYV